MSLYLLFPSDYFDPKRVDPDMETEYNAAVDTGLFEIILFDYDKWTRDNRLRLDKKPPPGSEAVYRGWMMKPEKYGAFFKALLDENIRLITDPREYELFHVFPNVYPFIREDTPEMIAFPRGEKVDIKAVKEKFPRFMIKDYVKSVKGTEFPRFFTNNVTEEEFDKAMELFFRYRGELYTGGICAKEYVSLKKYGDKTNEYRVFVMNGKIGTVSRNSNQPPYACELPLSLPRKYLGLKSPFYTLDCAELENGQWLILEAGDGQVSGLSPGQDPAAFFRALYHSIKEIR